MRKVAAIFSKPFDRMRRIFRSLKKHFRRHFPGYAVTTLLLLFIIVYFWQNIFITINSGEAGVLYRRFRGGTVVDRVYPEGLHLVLPWNVMTVYNVRYQTEPHEVEVLSKKGLRVNAYVTIRYRPEIAVLGVLHQEVGPDYLNRIILPEVEAKIRAILGQYDAEEIYTSQRGVLQQVVNESLAQVSQRFVTIDNVMITKVELPTSLREAIEDKLEEQQLAEAYEFKIAREEKEAERKRIEAGGIKAYNDIVDLSLNERLLRWKGIEATLELSKSPNSKVIIIGSGKDGLPIILDANK